MFQTERVKIKSITKINSTSKRYDIGVANTHSFFANNILVHNSLGILFFYKKNWIMSTRGSFNSDQAIKGFEILKRNHINFEKELDVNYTYIFEILYPENKIVVNYGNVEKIVWLGMIETKTGLEKDIYNISNSFEKVKRYDFKDYNSIQNLNWDNSEGFVIKFSNGHKCKIKFKDYVRLHKIITNTSSYTIWECLMNGDDFNKFLQDVPDEFFEFVREIKKDLESKYLMIESNAKKFAIINNQLDDKSFALKNIDENPEISSIIFSIRRGKDYSKGIWRLIKPKYIKAFSNKEEII